MGIRHVLRPGVRNRITDHRKSIFGANSGLEIKQILRQYKNRPVEFEQFQLVAVHYAGIEWIIVVVTAFSAVEVERLSTDAESLKAAFKFEKGQFERSAVFGGIPEKVGDLEVPLRGGKSTERAEQD